jgi:O-antigen/teichoic acid export membrane protein
MMLNMAGGVLMGRIVAPATLGLFNGIGLVQGYAPFLQLGILNGLNRELPYYVGKGDRQRVEGLAAAAQAWALAVGGVVCLALLGIAGWQLALGKMWLAAGWFTNAILALFLFYTTTYLQCTYRTAHDFSRLAWVTVVQSLVGLALLGLVAWLNFYGLCLRALLTGAIGTAILFLWRPVRVGPKWNAGHLKHLLVIGAPIFGVGMLYSWWTVINSTLVLKFAGVEGMGLYAMVSMASSAMELLPSAVCQVVYPRMAEQFGRSHNLDELLRPAWKPMLVTAAGLIPVIAGAWWLVGPVVRLVVPAYAAAVPAMQWGLLTSIVASFGPVCNVFNVIRRQDLYVVAILLGMAASGGSLMWLIRNGVSLVAFPQAMLIGRVVFMLLCYIFIMRMRHREQDRNTVAK